MQAAEPLAITTTDAKAAQRVPIPYWVAGGALLLLAAVFAMIQQWIPAGVSAAIGAVLGIVGLAKKMSAGRGPLYLRAGMMLGKGPHTRANAAPNATVVQAVGKVVEQLRAAAATERWPVDWTKFNALLQAAHVASANGDFTKSLRDMTRAMSLFLSQLRKLNVKRPGKPPDEVDLT